MSFQLGLQVPAHDAMADCPRPPARMVVLGDDMLWDLDLQAMRAADLILLPHKGDQKSDLADLRRQNRR